MTRRKRLQPLFEEHVKFAAPLGMLRYNEKQMQATGPSGMATHIAAGTDFDDVLNNRAWFCGTPADTVAHLQKIQEKYPGLEQILIAFPMGSTQAQFKDQLTRLSEEVMPAFQTGLALTRMH